MENRKWKIGKWEKEKGNGKFRKGNGKCEKEKGEMKNIYSLLLTKE